MIWAFAVNDTVPRAILIKDHCERIEVSPEVVDPVTGKVLQHAVRKVISTLDSGFYTTVRDSYEQQNKSHKCGMLAFQSSVQT